MRFFSPNQKFYFEICIVPFAKRLHVVAVAAT